MSFQITNKIKITIDKSPDNKIINIRTYLLYEFKCIMNICVSQNCEALVKYQEKLVTINKYTDINAIVIDWYIQNK